MANQPNIVLVLTDTQSLNAVGSIGESHVETPTIDRLAREGVSFENAYSAAPVCTPARGCLFTGQYPHGAGAWTNNVHLYEGVTRMGEYFSGAGYRTAYVGKWHLDGDYFGDGVAPEPYEQEFWYDGEDYRQEVGEEFWEWWRSGMWKNAAEPSPEEIRERGITREDTWAGRVTDRAQAFLESVADDQPYLLVVSYDEPHEPSLCPPEYAERYVDDPYPLPENYESTADLAANGKPAHQIRRAEKFTEGGFFIDSLSSPEEGIVPRPVYFGCASFVDDEIGRIVKSVDELDPDGERTAITFTSDHGHHLGAHGHDSKWATMYEEVLNVPLVVRYPDKLPAGETRSVVTSHVDLLPTFLDLADIETDSAIHGTSMRESLLGEGAHREAALIEYHSFARGRTDGDGFFPIRCLVTDELKLVVNLLESDELYDLERDPEELTNRIDDPEYTEVRDALHDELLARMNETDDPFDGDVWRNREWRTNEC